MELPRSASFTFSGLSAVAFLSIWGRMAANGTLIALLSAAWSGNLPDGTRLKTNYTEIWPLDFPITILVAFFFGLQDMKELTSFLMLVDLVAALLVINIMALVEACRSQSSKWLQSSLLWQYLWNCVGVALVLPIYSSIHLKQQYGGLPRSRIAIHEDQALPLTAVFTLLLPIPLLAPGLFSAGPLYIQGGFILYLLTPAIGVFFHSVASKIISKRPSNSKLFASPAKTAYCITGVASALIHLGILFYILLWAKSGLSLANMYLPHHNIVQHGRDDILTKGALLFFQWDYIIINLVVIFHGAYLLQHAAREARRPSHGSQRSLFEFVVLVVLLGPGAGLAIVLGVNEDYAETTPATRGDHPHKRVV